MFCQHDLLLINQNKLNSWRIALTGLGRTVLRLFLQTQPSNTKVTHPELNATGVAFNASFSSGKK